MSVAIRSVTARFIYWATRARAWRGAPNASLVSATLRICCADSTTTPQRCRTTDVNGQPMLTMRRDYTALVPVLRHRYEPTHPAVVRLFNAPHDLSVTIDAAL